MKSYKKPVVEIIVFDCNDIIATSHEFPDTVQNTGWVGMNFAQSVDDFKF